MARAVRIRTLPVVPVLTLEPLKIYMSTAAKLTVPAAEREVQQTRINVPRLPLPSGTRLALRLWPPDTRRLA